MGFTNVTRLEGGIVSYSKFAKEEGLESKFKVRATVGQATGRSDVSTHTHHTKTVVLRSPKAARFADGLRAFKSVACLFYFFFFTLFAVHEDNSEICFFFFFSG